MRGFAKCVGILLLACPVIAPAAFFFKDEGRFPVLGEEISYREDTGGASTFEDVMADGAAWVSQRQKRFRATGEPVHLWARFDIPPGAAGRRVLLRAGAWERAEYFVLRDGQLVDRQKVGTLVPLGERTTRVTMTPASFHAGFVAVAIPAGAHVTVVARLATENRFVPVASLRFSLWDADEVAQGELGDRLLEGVFLGAMLILALYNLTLFLLDVRERSYFYYVVLLAATTIVWAMMYGLTLEFLWPEHPAWDFYSMWIALPVSAWSFAQFERHYLDTRKHFPLLDVALKWAGYSALALLPIYLVPFAVNRPVSTLATLMGMVLVSAIATPLLLGTSVLAIVRRRPTARIFFVALACSAIGGFVTFGSWLGLLPEEEWALNAAQVGTVLTGVLLSMGLAFRIRQTRMELAETELTKVRLQGEHEREMRELVEAQSRGLEAKVAERTAELLATREKSDALLANILPQAIIEELKTHGESEPRRHEEASILFTDFSGFTEAVSTIPAKRLVQELDQIFRGFDDIIAAHGLEKIKTIGDAYMAAGGLPISAEDHALRCVGAGLALTRFIETRNKTAAMKWGLRVGVHSGAVVAGIVGKNKYAYDVWGDTVNIASRLESAGEVNRVNISAYTFELIRETFECEYRGKLAAKGKGEIDMYFVVRRFAGEVT